MAFYQRLKDLKEDADLTQEEISEIIEVSTNHYGKYERGETEIKFCKALIEKIFNVFILRYVKALV